MRINNNLMAMNTHRQLGAAQQSGAKSMEKLSSGLRINRAGDDAAGLSISEKMRGQIRGLNQASRNAQDGISLIQTAEGALNETHSILQRMRELAVQAANDTNVNIDRGALQAEIDELAKEVTRIADDTEFNTQKLLGGDFSAKFHIGANAEQNIDIAIGDMASETLKIGSTFLATAATGTDPAIIEKLVAGSTAVDTGPGAASYTFFEAGATIGASEVVASVSGYYDLTTDADAPTLRIASEKELADDAEVVLGINISSQENADKAITTINNALETVSSQRSNLGAVQNRLEHTINNLTTSAENLQAAEARIRDVDMAAEMMEFTKQNILQQASTAMMAQANQAPQSVLQLLG